MAVHFALTLKGAATPARLQQVDDDMRIHFGAEPDAANWFRAWYDIAGFSLACGRTWDDLHADWHDNPDILEVITYLEDRYEVSSSGYCR